MNPGDFCLGTRSLFEIQQLLTLPLSSLARIEYSSGPGTLERMGLGYDVLSSFNPRIVVGRIKGFGLSGPYRDYAASELTLFHRSCQKFMISFPEVNPQPEDL